jgi:hypothetical protein
MQIVSGNVCKASNGDLGIVCHKDGKWYYGIGINGGVWRSRNPIFVAESVAQLLGRIFGDGDDIKVVVIDEDA